MTPTQKRITEIQERLKAATPVNLANLPDYAMGIKLSVVPTRGYELSVDAPLENASLYHHASSLVGTRWLNMPDAAQEIIFEGGFDLADLKAAGVEQSDIKAIFPVEDIE